MHTNNEFLELCILDSIGYDSQMYYLSRTNKSICRGFSRESKTIDAVVKKREDI